MWEVYDCLLDGLPGGESIRGGYISPIWTCVTSTCGTGLAMTPPQEYHINSLRGKVAGMALKELAASVRSWNFYEAALGLAAINSYYNRPERLPQTDGIIFSRQSGIFGGFEQLIRGKKVAMIGHGPYVEELSALCEFTVLERLPRTGDLPDSACEYVLPQQDYVFITATALENKTMERLLTLTRNCFTVIWGPSTPLCGRLLELGADALLGSMVLQPEETVRIAGEGGYSRDLTPYTRGVHWFKDPAVARKFL